MIVSFPTALRSATLAASLAASLAVAVPAGAETLKIHYGVSLIGLTIGSASITGSIEPSSYRIEASAKLSGLASILSTSQGAATATGTLAGGHVRPATYATTSANATMTRTIRMAMEAGTVTGVDISPPFDPQMKRVPVTEADKRNIVDPLGAFVLSVPPGSEATGPAACNRRLPVFDGAVRFDIALNYVGSRHVTAKGFDGPVAVCAVRYVPISGQRVDSKSAQFMADNKNLEVWLAPLGGTRLVFPFRISVRTAIGTTVIEADEFETEATHASVR